MYTFLRFKKTSSCKFFWTLVSSVVVCSVAVGSAAPAGDYLIADGAPQAQIVIAAEPPRTVQLAAGELQRYLKKISGAELPIVAEPEEGSLRIYVGRSLHTDGLGIETSDLEHGAFRMVSGQGWLALVGNDQDHEPKEPWARHFREQDQVLEEWDRITGEHFGNYNVTLYREVDHRGTGLWEHDLDNAGSFNAVTQFLRDLGVRWYMPGELGEVVPEKQSVALPRVDRTVIPDFPLRNLYQHGTNFWSGRIDEILWRFRLGNNKGGDLVGFVPNSAVSHGIKWVISRDEVKEASPEKYKLVGGRRQAAEGVPCLSSDELVAANVRYLRAVFDTYDPPMVSVMPTDGFTGLCQCESCQGKGTPERGRLGSLSDYVWDYVVRVAEEIAESHPDKKIQCLAYTTYLLPPETIDKLPPNVVVGIAQNRSNFNRPEWRDLFLEIRRGWAEKITSGIPPYQYEYYLQDHETRQWAGLPVLYPRLIVEDLRSLRGHSLGDFAEVYRGGVNPINLFNVYITSRFYWDVDLDLEQIEDEYFRLFYGPAEVPMRKFYALAEENWRDFSGGDIEALNQYLDEAQALAGDSLYGQRVLLVREKCEAGMRTVYVRKKEPELRLLSYLDVAGIEPTANVDSLPVNVLTEMQRGEAITGNTTTVSLGWTGDGLFIRAVCEEDDMAGLRAFATERDDMAIFRDDYLEVVIALPGHRGYYRILINPLGVYAAIDRSRPHFQGLDWQADLDIQTFREDGQWVIECIIPASQLGADDPTREYPWLVNVGRVRNRGSNRQLSSLVPTGHKSIGLPERMAKFYYPSQQ